MLLLCFLVSFCCYILYLGILSRLFFQLNHTHSKDHDVYFLLGLNLYARWLNPVHLNCFARSNVLNFEQMCCIMCYLRLETTCLFLQLY